MRFLVAVACFMFVFPGCKIQPQKPTLIKTEGIYVSHDPKIDLPPNVSEDKSQERLEVPPGSVIKTVATDAVPASGEKPFIPATTETVVTLPKTKGAVFYKSDTKTEIVGSKGFAPEKGATPSEKALTIWPILGAIMVAAGTFLCTPWGGSNYRVGAIIAAGGIGMAVIGKFIDRLNIPAPAIFGLSILFGLAVYYGYRVRHKQAEPATH